MLRAENLTRRTVLISLLLAALVLLAFAPSALADAISPESGGSPNADDIDTLYKIVLYIAIVIFVGVEGTLIYSLVKYRARRRGPEPWMVRGNTPLEVSWTVGAALILVILTVFTFIYLSDIKNPPPSGPDGYRAAGSTEFAAIDQPAPPGGNYLPITVVGRQYLWRYDYPGRPGELFSYFDMVVPVNTTVTLQIKSSDVVHSWWIPKLGGKADAVPGHVNETWFKITKPGSYSGTCAELCGEGHADMRARVIALPVAEFEQWQEEQRRAIREAQEGLAEMRTQREREEAAATQPGEAEAEAETQP